MRQSGSKQYFLHVPKNCLAVSELGFSVSRRKFQEARGCSEQFGSSLLVNLDLSLKLHQARYRNLCTPFVVFCRAHPRPQSLDHTAVPLF